jgi:hypothetical protein
MPIAEAKKKTYDYAVETCKHEITLASAVLTLTATLIKDVFKHPSWPAIGFMSGAWLSLFVSIVFGTRLLRQITSCLGDIEVDDNAAVRRLATVPGVLVSMRAQNRFFLGALALLIAFGLANIPWYVL